MNHDDLREWSRKAADWVYDYHTTLRDRTVRAPLDPGAVAALLPEAPPEHGEDVRAIFDDFARIVPPVTTEWLHPRVFSYFPATAAPASVLAEMLTTAVAAQGVLWETGSAATGIEQAMCGWLVQALGLPDHFRGTIHDSATTATLSAVLAMRERAVDREGDDHDLSSLPRIRLYASGETHAAVGKAARIAGIGQVNLVKVATGNDMAVRPDALEAAIAADRAAGLLPAGVMLCAGGASTGAFDRIGDCIAVARAAGLPVHVDASWAGVAMVAPEFRSMWAGVGGADSIVFNPHRWMGAQFDCAVQFLAGEGVHDGIPDADPADIVRAAPDYNEWSLPLGRRFRALKLWFLMRAYGLDGLRTRVRDHVAWAQAAAAEVGRMPGVEVVTPPSLSLFTFALTAGDLATEDLLHRINGDGRILLTGTRHRGRFVIRVQVGSFDCTAEDVAMVPRVVAEMAQKVMA